MRVLGLVLCLSVVTAALAAEPSNAGKTHGRADERLGFLVGQWTSQNTHFASPLGPAGTSTGTTACRWDMSGWLLYESKLTIPGVGPYEARGGVTRNPRGPSYRAFSYNTLGMLVEYDGAWESETRLVFTALRTAPGRGARVLYEKRPDGSVLFASEMQRPDGGFDRYFESVMTH